MTKVYTKPSSGSFIRTSDVIGQRLCQEAIWHRGRCNWVGAEPVERSRNGGEMGSTHKALGPDLYSGTSGVALFLGNLSSVTGETKARRTALGAIRQALAYADTVPPLDRLGFYSGWTGIAFAAARLGRILDEEELLEQTARLLRRFAVERRTEHEYDLISGRAGSIAALVVLRDELDDPSLLELAVQLGEELLKTAEESDAGYSWRSAAFSRRRNLTGFSHGTAGAGYALLELGHATGDSAFLAAADRAFRYERYWFDVTARNWPDFRQGPARGRRGSRHLSFATYWCHGAPGIALSRLRAYEVLRDETCKEEAYAGLLTTREATEKTLRSRTGNFSLCHGLAGNVEVLLYGNSVLGREGADDFALALEVANTGVEIYGKRGLPWPCGVDYEEETPNLMLGLAGIGHFYLRLYDSTTPSILILRREDFSSDPSRAPT